MLSSTIQWRRFQPSGDRPTCGSVPNYVAGHGHMANNMRRRLHLRRRRSENTTLCRFPRQRRRPPPSAAGTAARLPCGAGGTQAPPEMHTLHALCAWNRVCVLAKCRIRWPGSGVALCAADILISSLRHFNSFRDDSANHCRAAAGQYPNNKQLIRDMYARRLLRARAVASLRECVVLGGSDSGGQRAMSLDAKPCQIRENGSISIGRPLAMWQRTQLK